MSIKYSQTIRSIPFQYTNLSSELNDFDLSISNRLQFVTDNMNTVTSVYYKTKTNDLIQLPIAQGKDTVLSYDAIPLLTELTTKLKKLRQIRMSDEIVDAVYKLSNQPLGNLDIVQRYFSRLELYNATAVSFIADLNEEQEENKVMTKDGYTVKLSTKTTPIKETMRFVATCKDVDVDLCESLCNMICELRTSKNTVKSSQIMSYSNDLRQPALHHLNLNSIIDSSKHSTALNEFLENRIPHNQIETFKAFVWSAYVSDNMSRQLVYIYDPHGNSGKSVFFKVIFKPLSDINAQSTSDKSFSGEFGMESHYDKRVLILADNKNAQIIRYQLLHTLTGHDEIVINAKNIRHFTFTPRMSIWAHSNILPEIDMAATHERTRIAIFNFELSDYAKKQIYVTDEQGNLIQDSNGHLISKGDNKFYDKLLADLPYFLAECKEAYSKLCPTNADIDIRDIACNAVELYNANEQMIEIDQFLQKYVKVDLSAQPMDCITASELKDLYQKAKDDKAITCVAFADIKEHILKLGCKWNYKSHGRRCIFGLVIV